MAAVSLSASSRAQLISQFKSQDPLSLLRRWPEVADTLPFHKSSTKLLINERVGETVLSQEADAQIREMSAWKSCPDCDLRVFKDTRDVVSTYALSMLEQSFLSGYPDSDVQELVYDSWDIVLWNRDSDSWNECFSLLGARQLFGTLCDGARVSDWQFDELRPFELRALRNFARRSIASGTHSDWPREDQRVALLYLAEKWQDLAQAASRAIDADVPFRPYQVVVFVRHAPLSIIHPWLSQHLDAPGHVLSLVFDEIQDRIDSNTALMVLDAVASNRTAIDPFSDFSTQPWTLPDSVDAKQVLQRLLAWTENTQAQTPTTLVTLLARLDVDSLGENQKRTISRALLQQLSRAFQADQDDETYSYRTITVAAYDFLAKAHIRQGEDFVLKTVDDYCSGKKLYGSRDRAALMASLRHLQRDDVDVLAKRFAEATRREAEQSDYDDSAVQAEYLQLVSDRPESWETHSDYVARLMLTAATSNQLSFFDRPPFLSLLTDSLAHLLSTLGDTQVSELFERCMFDSGLDRAYFLGCLCQGDRRIPDTIEQQLIRTIILPIPELSSPLVEDLLDDDPDASVLQHLAHSGNKASRNLFKRHYRNGNKTALRHLALMGDVASVQHAVQNNGVDNMSAVVESLPQKKLERFLIWALERELDEAFILRLAYDVEFVDRRLITLAQYSMHSSQDRSSIVAAARYLQSFAPDALVSVFEQRATVEKLAKLLGDRAKSPIALAESIMLNNQLDHLLGRPVPSTVHLFAPYARATVVLEKEQVSSSWASGFLSHDSHAIRNPLLVLIAMRETQDAAWTLVKATTTVDSSALGQSLPDAANAYRSYGLWLAAGCLAGDPPPISEVVIQADVLLHLFSKNLPIRRGAAALCIASTQGPFFPAKTNN